MVLLGMGLVVAMLGAIASESFWASSYTYRVAYLLRPDSVPVGRFKPDSASAAFASHEETLGYIASGAALAAGLLTVSMLWWWFGARRSAA